MTTVRALNRPKITSKVVCGNNSGPYSATLIRANAAVIRVSHKLRSIFPMSRNTRVNVFTCERVPTQSLMRTKFYDAKDKLLANGTFVALL